MQANIEQVGLPKWSDDDQTLAKAVQRLVDGKEDGLAHRRCASSSRRSPRPESGGFRRHRRRLVERADGHAQLSVEHPEPARPQLVERDRHGDADRPQGRRRGRQGAGDDDGRSADAAGGHRGGEELLHRRPAQEQQVHFAAVRQRPAADPAQPRDDGALPPADAASSITTPASTTPISTSSASSSRPSRRGSSDRSITSGTGAALSATPASLRVAPSARSQCESARTPCDIQPADAARQSEKARTAARPST